MVVGLSCDQNEVILVVLRRVVAADVSLSVAWVSVTTMKSNLVMSSARTPNFLERAVRQLHVRPFAFQVAPLTGDSQGLSGLSGVADVVL